jgi:hypothetical protein
VFWTLELCAGECEHFWVKCKELFSFLWGLWGVLWVVVSGYQANVLLYNWGTYLQAGLGF